MPIYRRRIVVTFVATLCCCLLGPTNDQPTAIAQVVLTESDGDSQSQILERLDRTERLLQQTQRELQTLKDKDAERQLWEQSVIERLPPVGSDFQFTTRGTSTGSPTCDVPLAGNGCASPGNGNGKEPIVADYARTLVPLATDCGDITWRPGVRIQSRYLYDDANDNNDFFIRRFRLKGSGDLFGIATYGTELKFDSTGRINTDPEPEGVVENAWLDFTLLEDSTFLRVGLYDVPFSRNALTSDSKLLFMDRTLIKNTLTAVGMTDNTIGLMLHGRPRGGQVEYMVGIFDNQRFEQFNPTGGNVFDPAITRDSRQLMPAGRIVLNLLDPAEPPQAYADYKESYLGEGRRLALGANAAYLGNTTFNTTAVPVDEFDLTAWGFDVFFNSGPFVFAGEYDWFQQGGANVGVRGDGWYVQAGYLLNDCQYMCCDCHYAIEIAGRYQESDTLAGAGTISDRLAWTSVGLNFYIREHNLKIQTDYTIKSEEVTRSNNDVFQLQLQMDY